LKIEVHLNASAQSHSEWMADTGELSHTDEDGLSATDRIEETGFPLTGSWKTSENLAFTTLTGDLDADEVDRMHEGLMDSAGHRANILDPEVSYVGIGLAPGELTVGGSTQDAVFLTQNFAETDGEVLVQEEVDGQTVLQPYQDGEPVGEPEPVDDAEEDQDDDEDDAEDQEEDPESDSGSECFVATAAYGGRSHPDVRKLRRFRNKVLVRHAVGRTLIHCYQVIGPRMAQVVSFDGVSGRVSRAVISPLARLAGTWADRRR
jgi:hypothetical protein